MPKVIDIVVRLNIDETCQYMTDEQIIKSLSDDLSVRFPFYTVCIQTPKEAGYEPFDNSNYKELKTFDNLMDL